jgi:microcystin-dependent protein
VILNLPSSGGGGGTSNYYLNDQPLGAIIDYAGSNAPANWLLCYGQLISRTTYSDLFSAIGTTYGVGDGSTTFALPDLRGRVTAGKDNMGGTAASRLTSSVAGTTLGAVGGEQAHQLSLAELASHSHNVPYHSSTSSSAADGFSSLGVGPTNGVSSYNSGGDQAHNNVQPTIIMNKIIKYTVSATAITTYTYTGTGNIMTGQSNSNNYIPYWSSNNSTFLTNGISLSNLTCANLYSATTTVSISGATAPSSNQVLTAISASNAIWSTPVSGGSSAVTLLGVNTALTGASYIVTWGSSYSTITIKSMHLTWSGSGSCYYCCAVSTNSGSTWSGDINIALNQSPATAVPYANLVIYNINTTGTKYMHISANPVYVYGGAGEAFYTLTYSGSAPINGIKFYGAGGTFNFTAGAIFVYGQ